MTVKISITPSGHSYDADPAQTVLQSALDAGFILPYGCRNGACGTCKGRILSGDFDLGDFQDNALTAEDRARGYALFCCAKPRTDLTIECREVGSLRDIPIRTLPCRVQKIERPAEDVSILYLKLPANERLQFLPGQYIDFLLKDGRRRSFSLANAPHDDEFLQLHIRHVPGGQFTDHVFGAMKERDILRLEGPLGSFYLREDEKSGKKPILLLAGGTGFAPIKAIVEHARHHRMERPMTLYWGARDRTGLYLDDLAQEWTKTIPGFKYVSVVSDNPSEDKWQGRIGLVHQAVMADLPDLSQHQVYACGAPGMIDAARRDFVGHCHLPDSEFFADSFTFAADSQPA
ncbi:MAG TPA: CDP-6-deoxy-delta-3,4-glucoseen reductase [Rhodocyclaceae bacterium]|nr:CDP-6-deoxy-delta-3,4-glucoseen reductase [Rhodocyclaceae bacterium]HMZ84323.1 CDP-6-deoxy-delta-3,4-glucoseen reductase [Rhodocyclaceae bacterium]HNA03402.1 CDP-6-deoxy-delta-3,4-glucoseen reductase [Rhodocyclaceae bacterium]HNB77730.1 CDP-6-deoxy-delta-3,4-glucoseen reductase [Rhodocyclaceae bacterium]HNC60461.1 CDP-6-deoxy-delta-3,4-glucoseen reductase [Rhodocyclaceae bacterium]